MEEIIVTAARLKELSELEVTPQNHREMKELVEELTSLLNA